MKVNYRRIISIVTIIVMLLSISIPAFADISGKLQIEMKAGSDRMSANGKEYKVEKPVPSKGTVLVPLATIARVLGGEVIWKGNGIINIAYRSADATVTLGKTSYKNGDANGILKTPPVLINGKTMVPLELIGDVFSAKTEYTASNGKVTILQEDDGALSDLSFLIGGIGNGKIGNSYFGWTMNVPKNSRITSNSFNSREITIENQQKGLVIDISIDAENSKTLEEYYKEVTDEASGNSGYFDDILVDSVINTKSNPNYCEFIYASSYSGSLWERVYMDKGYLYRVTLTSSSELNAEKLVKNQVYKAAMDSFKLGYKGNSIEIIDLSKVKNGLAAYDNYAVFDYSNKYLTWSINVPAEWKDLNASEDSLDILGGMDGSEEEPLSTRLGMNQGEYIDVVITKDEENKSIDEIAEMYIEDYAENFNPQIYEFVDQEEASMAGVKTSRLIMTLKQKNKQYRLEETFIKQNGLIYDITLKMPIDKYKSDKNKYYEMLDSFKIPQGSNEALLKDIDNYNGSNIKVTVGKDNTPVDVKNKTYSWSVKIPGKWSKNSYSDDMMNFSNDTLGMSVSITTNDKLSAKKTMTDEEENQALIHQLTTYSKYNFVSMDKIEAKNTSVRVFNFRFEDEEKDIYQTIKYYYFEDDKYIYLVIATIADLTASDKNLKEIEAIWESFATNVQSQSK